MAVAQVILVCRGLCEGPLAKADQGSRGGRVKAAFERVSVQI